MKFTTFLFSISLSLFALQSNAKDIYDPCENYYETFYGISSATINTVNTAKSVEKATKVNPVDTALLDEMADPSNFYSY